MSNWANEPAKLAGDIASVTTVIGTLAGILPSIAAIFTIIWTSIRIYETETIQKWINRRQD